jgi:hypothetical protein
VTDTIKVFVNATGVELPGGARVSEAVAAYDPALLSSVSSGAAYVTDGRGIEIEGDAPLTSGAILRVVVRARRGTDADA